LNWLLKDNENEEVIPMTNDHKVQDRISPFPGEKEKGDKKEKEKPGAFWKSLKRYYYFSCSAGNPPTPLNLAYLGDALLKEAQLHMLFATAEVLGYEPKLRSEISDYKRHRLPRIRVGMFTYYLVSSQERSK
jgi:hypothetical protein